MECVGESATEADKWIVNHWADITPNGESVGITDSAHVRAAVRRAKKTWLATCELRFNESCRVTEKDFQVIDPSGYDWIPLAEIGEKYETEGCAVLALEVYSNPFEYLAYGFPRACMWMNGMRTTQPCKSIPIHDLDKANKASHAGISLEDRKGVTQVAAGVAELFGLTQLRELRRLHRGRGL